MRLAGRVAVVLASACACALPAGCSQASCVESPDCGKVPVGLVEIPPADMVPAPASAADVNCAAPSAADAPFCSVVSRYLGRVYDSDTKTFGSAVAAPGIAHVADVQANCSISCTKETKIGGKLKIPVDSCSVGAGVQTSKLTTTADGTELDEHVSLNPPSSNSSEDWDLTQELTNLRAFCASAATASQQVAIELWTGKVNVQTMESAGDSVSATLCCGNTCLDGSLDSTVAGQSTWNFQGTVGVKLLGHDDFCDGAAVWLDKFCGLSRSSLLAACADTWWDR